MITAEYLGTSIYNASSTSQNFEVTGGELQPTETTIKSANSTSVGKAIKMYYADGTKLVVKVVNSDNVPQVSVTVNVKIMVKLITLLLIKKV